MPDFLHEILWPLNTSYLRTWTLTVGMVEENLRELVTKGLEVGNQLTLSPRTISFMRFLAS